MDFSRISLRPIKLSDVDDLLKRAGDDRVTRYLRWDTIAPRVAIAHPRHWIVCLDDRSIGYIMVKPCSGEDRCQGHISYAVGADYWGQGIAKVAMKMAISLAFKELADLARLETLVEVENIGPQKVFEKIGFLKEGLLGKYGYCKVGIRDMLLYIVSYQLIKIM